MDDVRTRRVHLRTSNMELQSWMERLRGRCQVLESMPTPAVVDAMWSKQSTIETKGFVGESTPLASIADAKADSCCSEERRVASLPEAWQERVRAGQPLSHNLRSHFWTQHLQIRKAQVNTGLDDSSHIGFSMLLAVLGARIAGDLDEGSEMRKSDTFEHLAIAFSEKFLNWLTGQYLFHTLVALLRYHDPSVVSMLEEASPSGASLPALLDHAFGGSLGLATLLLNPCINVVGHECNAFEILLLLCDRTVVELDDNLLLFVVVSLLLEAPPLLGQRPGLEPLAEWVRTCMLNLRRRGFDGVSKCVDVATILSSSTPLSLCSALAMGTWLSTSPEFPICVVTPDELLTHVYETPRSTWRLVVLDIRGANTGGFALPLCVRLGPSQEDRKAVLASLPYEDCIHLCLLSEDAGEAIGLCRVLSAAPICRRHLSIVAGGWLEVSRLAECLGLELFPLEIESSSASL